MLSIVVGSSMASRPGRRPRAGAAPSQDGVVDLPGRPATDLRAAMEENLETSARRAPHGF